MCAKLLILEPPGKVKKVQEILGSGWKVLAEQEDGTREAASGSRTAKEGWARRKQGTGNSTGAVLMKIPSCFRIFHHRQAHQAILCPKTGGMRHSLP